MDTKIQEQMQQKNLASAGEVRQTREVTQTDNVAAAAESKAERNDVVRIDQYIPSKGEQTESFGHYQPVKDENGNSAIQFNAPTEASGHAGGASGTGAERTKDAAQAQKGQTDSFSLSSGKLKLMGLKKKQKNLEQQIRQAPDPESKQELKKKLAQVKRDVKAAER